MKTGIYKITNTVNGKCYIGQSIDLKQRWIDHKKPSSKKCVYLSRALKKYGIDAFTFEVLLECPVESLDFFEIAFIEGYDSFGDGGYNLTKGGCGSRGTPCSDEKRLKLSMANNGRVQTPAEKIKQIAAQTGKYRGHYKTRRSTQ